MGQNRGQNRDCLEVRIEVVEERGQNRGQNIDCLEVRKEVVEERLEQRLEQRLFRGQNKGG